MTRLMPSIAIALRQLYLVRGSFPRFMQLFIWVAVDMILWGFITRYLNKVASQEYNFVTVMLGAVFLWDLLIRIMQGVTLCYMEDSWSRNLFNIFVAPVTIGSYLTGLVLASIATSMVGLTAMLILATGLFGLPILSYGLALIPFLMILFLFGIALGILGCAMMLRMGPSAEWLVWPLPFILSPFVGVFYPLNTLPHWMQLVGHTLPVSYVFENLRGITAGGAVSHADMLIGLGLGVGYILLACLLFAAIFRRALKTGSIARYAAENY